MMRGVVGEHNTIVQATASIKIKRTQINPCTTTHGLIDQKMSCLPAMINDIFGIGHAFFRCLITHIHGKASCLLKCGLIGNKRRIFASRGFRHARRPLFKRIFTIFITSLMY